MTLDDILSHASSKGWSQEFSPDGTLIILNHPNPASLRQITIPADPEAPDYDEAIQIAASKLEISKMDRLTAALNSAAHWKHAFADEHARRSLAPVTRQSRGTHPSATRR